MYLSTTAVSRYVILRLLNSKDKKIAKAANKKNSKTPKKNLLYHTKFVDERSCVCKHFTIQTLTKTDLNDPLYADN
jgi:hypothetical protein